METNIRNLLPQPPNILYKFSWKEEKYKLHGFQSPKNQIVSSHQMMKLVQKGALAYIVQCYQIDILTSKLVNVEPLVIQDFFYFWYVICLREIYFNFLVSPISITSLEITLA